MPRMKPPAFTSFMLRTFGMAFLSYAHAYADDLKGFFVSGVTLHGIKFSGHFVVDTDPIPSWSNGIPEPEDAYISSGSIRAGKPVYSTYNRTAKLNNGAQATPINCDSSADGSSNSCYIYLQDSNNFFIGLWFLASAPNPSAFTSFTGGPIQPYSASGQYISCVNYVDSNNIMQCDQVISGSSSTIPPTNGIFFDYENIINSTHTVSIGQQIVLTGFPAPDQNQPQAWNISGPGPSVGGYTPTEQSFATAETISVDQTDPNTTIYWTTPGAYSVTYTPTVGGPTYTTEFQVVGPVVNSASADPNEQVTVTSAPGAVQFVPNNQEPTGIVCGLTDDATRCVTFSVSSTYSKSHFEWVQIVNHDIVKYHRPHSTSKLVAGAVYCNPPLGLDTEYPVPSLLPYTNPPLCAVGSQFCFGDHPGDSLGDVNSYYSRDFSATTYLMFNPHISSSDIFVPIGTATWYWSALATETAKDWSMTETTGPTIGAFTSTSQFPTWNFVLKNGAFDSIDNRAANNCSVGQ